MKSSIQSTFTGKMRNLGKKSQTSNRMEVLAGSEPKTENDHLNIKFVAFPVVQYAGTQLNLIFVHVLIKYRHKMLETVYSKVEFIGD